MKRWYVVQVYAGYEEAVKTDLLKRIQETGTEGKFGEILVPSARLKHFFAVDESQDEQLFPGYMLIQMEADPQAIKLVTSNSRVLRFLGGKTPIPLSQKEIDRVISQMKGEVVLPTEKIDFVVGSEVEIKDGPFAGFVGLIDKVDTEDERLTVMVSIFGRMTPVELGFNQVKR